MIFLKGKLTETNKRLVPITTLDYRIHNFKLQQELQNITNMIK